MKYTVEIFKYKFFDYDLKVGIYNNKICYVGFNKENVKELLKGKNFLIIEKNNDLNKCFQTIFERFLNEPNFVLDLKFFHLFGTDFQIKVWKELAKVKKKELIYYSDLAKKIHMDSAVRAVSTAVGKNPISLLIPCHRIIGKNNMYKYRSGPEIKKFLLDNQI